MVETVRALRAADVRRLGNVLARAYESPHNFELPLEEYLRRAAATFVAEVDGVPVGIVVGNDYGTTAYVSMMGVDPAMQRRGIGSALMRALSAWAQQRRFAAIELDATPSGSPLYARFGFTPAGRTLVYVAGGAGGDARAARRYGAADRAAVLATDRHAFGADRGDVLRPLLEWAPNAVVVRGPRHAADGYADAQPRSDLLGPVVAPDGASAAALIDASRTRLAGTHRVNVPSDNRSAQAILQARGYRFARSFPHLVLGRLPLAARDTLFARINLGYG